MAEIKLYSMSNNNVTEMPHCSVDFESRLQKLVESNMELFFGVRFLKSEFQTTNGRMDSIGIDENNCSVIFEYKRSMSENIINQGLYYLDWLMDHKADFKILVMEKLLNNTVSDIDWSSPCVICIANDFTKFDEHAVNQMNRNIKLVRYRSYNDLILFEHINNPIFSTTDLEITKSSYKDKTFQEQLDSSNEDIRNLYSDLNKYILSLGDDITENKLKLYVAFKKVRNIVCVEVRTKQLTLYLRLIDITEEKGFMRDVTNIGHWGTGNQEVIIRNQKELEKAKVLILQSYNEN